MLPLRPPRRDGKPRQTLDLERLLAKRYGYGFAAVCRADFREYRRDVLLDALLLQPEPLGDVGVGEPARHRFEDLQLTRREFFGGRVFGEKLLDLVGDRGSWIGGCPVRNRACVRR